MSSDRILQLKLTEQLLKLFARDYAALGEAQLYEVFQQVLQLRRQGIGAPPDAEAEEDEETPDAAIPDSSGGYSTRPVSRPALGGHAPPEDPLPATRSHPRSPNPLAVEGAETHWQRLSRRFAGQTPRQQWTLRPGDAAARALLQSAAAPGDNVLFIQSSALSCAAIFQTGSLVEIYTRDPAEDEALVELLSRNGLLGPEQRAQALAHAARYQVDIDEAILRERLVSYAHVLRALQQRVSLLVRRLLRLERAHFALYSADQLPRRYPTPPVSLFRLSYQVAREDLEATPPQILLERLSPLERRVHPTAEASSPLRRELRLAPEEEALYLKACEGEHTLDALLSTSPLGPHVAAAALAALQATGLLRFAAGEQGEPHDATP
jgi:hypothetical protein